MTLYYLRVAGLIIWLVAALALAPGFVRYLRGKYVGEYQTALFFVALLFIGSISRWLIAPSETAVLSGLQAMTAALGVYVFILTFQNRAKK